MTDTKSKPAPLETDPGDQKDDNIDDLGHKQGGGEQDQPVDAERGKDDAGPSNKR